MLWHIELKFCIWLCFTVLQIKFECRQLVSIFMGVMPLLELRILKIHSFPHFSLTCFEIHVLSWNLAYVFVLLYYRLSSSVVNLCQFLWELCPFWNFQYWKYTVFRTFLYMLWHIELEFFIWLCLLYYRSSLNVVTLCPSIFCTFLLYTCNYKLSWNLKFDIGFFNEFLLEKC